MSIAENLTAITATLPSYVRLVAVSKYHPACAIEEAYAAGQRIFGENKVQELVGKYETLPKDIEWHFIGHLQSNKIKYIAPFVTLIHGVDSAKLLTEIDRQGAKCGRVINCLLQIHIAQEETKFGFSFAECRAMLAQGLLAQLPHVRICGVMGMASNTTQTAQVTAEFCSLRQFFEETKHQYFASDAAFCELSMGMSGDYPLAIAQGATLIRIGSSIFGARNYAN